MTSAIERQYVEALGARFQIPPVGVANPRFSRDRTLHSVLDAPGAAKSDGFAYLTPHALNVVSG
jgi:hypothetical protein